MATASDVLRIARAEVGYDRYDDLDFAGWDQERGLLLRGFSTETLQYEPLSVPVSTLKEHLGL